MQLYFREAGQGQPLIILHGLFGSSDNWFTVTKPLAEKYHVYLIDQRNHGRSPHATEHTYQTMSDDILGFIREHHIDNPIVLGHSMGGKTAMHLALNHAHVVQKLIVVDISPRYYPPHHQSVIAGLKAIDLKTLTSREQADSVMASHISEIGERQFLLKNLYRNESGGFAWRMNLESIVGQIENIGEESKGSPFSKPTLFLRGEKSNYIQPKDTELIGQLFPNHQLETIMGAGHWVQAEKPIEFVGAVAKFIG